MTKYNMTIGIECHVQLATLTKLFSPADNDARSRGPNSVVHPIDYGLPGMLPILNHEAINLAIRAGKALNAEIARTSRFDRKHYFYPDLPNGYQITQMYQPIILQGHVEAPLEDGTSIRVRIHHAHLESDAGKLTHSGDYSLVDLNRAGTPLIEIVSEPDMHSPQEAKAYVAELHKLMVYAGVTFGDLYHGNMRFDVNISVAEEGASQLGTRTEIKNLNSFRAVERSAEYEYKRQVALIENGQSVVQETRGWDDNLGKTTRQRSKEEAQDYRYMPDPDIPPVILSESEIEKIQSEVPHLPPFYRRRWKSIGLDKSVIDSLLAKPSYAILISSIQDCSDDTTAKRVAHWFSSAISEVDQDTASIASTFVPESFVELAQMVDSGNLSSTAAKEVFNELLVSDKTPQQIADEKNLIQVSDEGAIMKIVQEVLDDSSNAGAVEVIKNGNEKVVGFLVGQVMKKSHGKANPQLVQEIIRDKLAI